MRRVTVVLMILSAVLMILTGIGESFHTGLPTHHIAAATLFLIAVCIHAWYTRKAMLKYFSGLGWRWAVIVGCLLMTLVVGNLLA